LLLDAFATGDWRTLEDEYNAGKITVGEFNTKAFAMLRADKNEMLDYLKRKGRGTRRFLKISLNVVKKKRIQLVIVSKRMGFLCKTNFWTIIGIKNLEYHSAETYFEGGK